MRMALEIRHKVVLIFTYNKLYWKKKGPVLIIVNKIMHQEILSVKTVEKLILSFPRNLIRI